jgi:tRNA(adenine34) deaminase
MEKTHEEFMRLALDEAQKAAQRDEVPIGAVLVHTQTGAVAALTGNRTIELKDPTAHAEILAIRAVCEKEGAQRIPDYDLYVTLEPCAMCAAAISFSRIRRVIFGASDPKGGGVLHGGKFFDQPTCHHRPEVVSGILSDECGQILKDFFRNKR